MICSYHKIENRKGVFMGFNIWNRRYTGSKYKLADWIQQLIIKHCKGNVFFDVFAGTGVVSEKMIDNFGKIILNDFLFSNNIIYNAFFLQEKYNMSKLTQLVNNWLSVDIDNIPDNFLSVNYGNKYFSYVDAKTIGYIRQQIETVKNEISFKEYAILLASLVYSADRVANTVGHYDAYIKGKPIADSFKFDFIKPCQIQNKTIEIYREDSNCLAKRIPCDVAYIDPPYNSRQYSRFYHVLETIVEWDAPTLTGTALKRPSENMSEYCRNSAKSAFEDLINSLDAKYIVVSYNNTYNSKSSSSRNKIELNDILCILKHKGIVETFEKEHQYFNAGKTDLADHKEIIFICKVKKDANMQRSPFFFVGDKRKLMPQLTKLFPAYINNYYEPFCGGGSSFLNTVAKKYFLNDVDSHVINLHNFFKENSANPQSFLDRLFELINNFGLSCSFKGITAPDELKKKYIKTYYAHFNKDAYAKLRNDFNSDQSNMMLLYLLLIYGFNHMIRFNSDSKFNLPVGNVDFNQNVYDAITGYFWFLKKHKEVYFSNFDFVDFLNNQEFKQGDFVYCDPPYLISDSEYNKIWNEDKEIELYNMLDKLNSLGVRFGITNLICHKGKKNSILIEWSKKYDCYYINSNYISFNDNTIKRDSTEVYVTNGNCKKETTII